MNVGWDDEQRQTFLHNELSGSVLGPVVQAASIDQITFQNTETELPVPFQLPPAPLHFSGRDGQLELMENLRSKNDRHPLLIVLDGMGGVGKTTLALRWLHDLRSEFPDGQLYVDLGAFSRDEIVQPTEALEWFLLALGVPGRRVPLGLAPRAALYRSMTANRSMVVLLDNALSAAQVRPLLPSSSSVVVVTSRLRLSGLAMQGARFVNVTPLDVKASLELLSQVVGNDRMADQHDHAEELARLCGGIPIALSLVGARLSTRPHRSLSREVGDLRSNDKLAALSLHDELSVRALFDLSYDSLPPEYARVYRQCALHPGPAFGVEAASAMAEQPVDDTEHALDALVEQNLVIEVHERRFRYHDLLLEHARLLVEPSTKVPTIQRMVEWYLDTTVAADLVLRPTRRRIGERYRNPPDPAARFRNRPEAYAWLDLERTNLVQAVEAANRYELDQLVWEFCEALWGFYLHARPYSDWLALHAMGIAAARRLGHSIAEARLHTQLGAAFTSLRRYSDSMRENLAALHLAERENDESIKADALLELASAEQGMGQLDTALQYLRDVIRIREVIGTPRAVALCRRRIGEVLIDLGRYEEAVLDLRAAAEVMAALDKVQEARALTSLGSAYLRWDRPAEARVALDAALAMTGELGSPYYKAAVLAGLGDVAERMGDLSLARRHRDEAYQIYAQSGDPRAADLALRLQE